MNSVIRGQKVFLKTIDIDDIEILTKWFENEKINCHCIDTNIYTRENLLEWLHASKDNSQRFLINTVDNFSIGKLFFDIEGDTAYINLLICDVIYQGGDYEKDVIKTIVKYCFEELNLNAVVILHHIDNIKDEYACYACGLKKDNSFMPTIIKEDVECMVIKRNEYIGY